MSAYLKKRLKIKAAHKQLMKAYQELFHYGCEVDRWLPEIVLIPYIALQWEQDHTWIRVIAPPGSGKSVHLTLLRDHPMSYPLDEFTPKSFVSGYREGGGEDPSTLPQLNNKVLIISDESTIIEQRQEDRNQIQAILRKAYDGSYGKSFGNIKERQEYKVYFNVLIGSTPVIDRYFLYNQALGERYVNYRLQVPDRRAIAQAAFDNQFKNFKERYEKLKQQTQAFLNLIPKVNISEIKIPPQIGELLIDVADFVALIRTKVTRDVSGQFVTTLPQPETAGRLVQQSTQICLSNAIIHGDKEVTMEHVHKAVYLALGSVCAVDVFVLYYIYLHTKEQGGPGEKAWFTPQHMGIKTTLSLRSVKRIIEDLAIHQVLDIRKGKKQGGRTREYCISKDVYDFIERVDIFKYYVPPRREEIKTSRLDRVRPRANRPTKKVKRAKRKI